MKWLTISGWVFFVLEMIGMIGMIDTIVKANNSPRISAVSVIVHLWVLVWLYKVLQII